MPPPPPPHTRHPHQHTCNTLAGVNHFHPTPPIDTRHARHARHQVSKAEFTQALIAIRTAALATSNKYDEEGEGKKSPFVISVDSYKWWKRVKPVDFDSKFGRVFIDNSSTVHILLGACVCERDMCKLVHWPCLSPATFSGASRCCLHTATPHPPTHQPHTMTPSLNTTFTTITTISHLRLDHARSNGLRERPPG